MKTFLWLIAAGVVWLGSLQLAPLLDFPPQLISLARSCYVGIFSIFMMLDLRRLDTSENLSKAGLRVADVGWFLVPLSTVVVLACLSRDLTLTPQLVCTLVIFYSCQLCLLFIRERLGQMRTAAWDLASPLVLIILIFSPFLNVVAATLCVMCMMSLLWLGRSEAKSSEISDSLIMQLPSLCLAPALLILVRDHVEFGASISRAHIETFGMIINGVGAALWTTLVMRASKSLFRWTTFLWLGGCALGGLGLSISNSVIGSAVTIMGAEIFRGTLWLGMTHLLQTSTRWVGFSVNLLGTSLPFCALLVARSGFEAPHLMPIYAAFHLAVPMALWFCRRRNRAVKHSQS